MIRLILAVATCAALAASSAAVVVFAFARRLRGVDPGVVFTLTVEDHGRRRGRFRWYWSIERLERVVADGGARTRLGAHYAARRRLPAVWAAWMAELDELVGDGPAKPKLRAGRKLEVIVTADTSQAAAALDDVGRRLQRIADTQDRIDAQLTDLEDRSR